MSLRRQRPALFATNWKFNDLSFHNKDFKGIADQGTIPCERSTQWHLTKELIGNKIPYKLSELILAFT